MAVVPDPVPEVGVLHLLLDDDDDVDGEEDPGAQGEEGEEEEDGVDVEEGGGLLRDGEQAERGHDQGVNASAWKKMLEKNLSF